MIIKKLVLKDLNLIKQKFKLDEEIEKSLFNYFLNESEIRYQIYGKFDNDLVAMLGIIDNLEIPAWTLSNLHSFGSSDNFKKITEHIIELKERESKYQFFTLNTEKEFNYLQDIFNRYQPYLEHIVLSDQFTGYENIDHDVLQYNRFKKNMCVYLWVLKNEYRTNKK